LTSKRTRSVTPASLEPIALLFVKLSVDLRKGFTLKDGLHQFKKNVQLSENGLPAVENVSRRLIELAEKKLETAQAEADERDNVEDDFEADSPEDILLSAVSSEQSKDRADRELVAPWLRFLWEAYRLVLDLLRNNARLEVTYSAIVQRAYKFCLKYNRTNEFKRLSELLRTHIQTASQKGGIKQVNAVDMQDPETVQRYIDLRFNQLNVSVRLELWQEAYRSIEDIHGLISSSRRPVKPHMMVSYYENLAKIFLVSDNALFHAAAWNKYFNLYSQSPMATEEELSRYASVFLLSSLAIPQQPFSSDFNEQYSQSSTQRLVSLLNLQRIPTRESLISAALTKTIYDYVDPTIKKLYQLLEADFHPLSIREDLNEITAAIEANAVFAPYVKPLTKVLMTRLFEQVSQVYESVKLDFLINLATFQGKFQLSGLEIESFLLNAGRDGQLSFYIDHDAGVITFRSDPFEEISGQRSALQTSPADLIQTQLSTLAKTLYASAQYTDPSYAEKQQTLRERLIASATAALVKEREEIERSRQLLEERKEQAEMEKKQREQEVAKARQQKLEEEKAAEAKRVEEEAKRRLEERIQREKDAVENENKKKLIAKIKSHGMKLDIENLEEVNIDELRDMQVKQLEKDKNDLESNVKSMFKKLDHTERAYRKAELPLLEKDASAQKDKDLKIYEEFKAKRIATAKKDHEEAIQLRDRLQKIVPDYESFRDEIDAEASAKRESLIMEQAAKLEAAKKARTEQIRQERYEKALAEYEAAKKRDEEEAQRAALEGKRREEARKLDEMAAKQRQAEEEAIARQSATRSTGGYKPPSARGTYRPPGARSDAGPVAREAPIPRQEPTPPAQQPSPTVPGGKMSYAEKMRLKRLGRT
jgi:translation initiation factor 3 subunit A